MLRSQPSSYVTDVAKYELAREVEEALIPTKPSNSSEVDLRSSSRVTACLTVYTCLYAYLACSISSLPDSQPCLVLQLLTVRGVVLGS